jgi:cytochrome P450
MVCYSYVYDCIYLVVASSETTATALSGTTYYLCRTPRAYEKLACEIREAFSSYGQINSRSAESLSYLKAVIDEGLRVYRPIPAGPPSDSPGETVDGYYMPKGTVVFVSTWAATHSHRNFHKPFDFIPERWLDPECKDEKTASQTFLLGSRAA